MYAFLNREIDVAEAMIYNEYAQVLETVNPETGELYQPEDLSVIDYNEVGTAMLQDAVWAREAWLAEEGNADIATRFLAASFQGWQYCRDNPDDCVEIVTEQRLDPRPWPPGLDDERDQRAHLAVADGIGAMPRETWDKTVQIMLDAGHHRGRTRARAPGEATSPRPRGRLLARLRRGPVTGEGFEKAVVEVTPGGE